MMLQLLISLFAILITIFFVIGTHEFAHFITARWLGVKVLRFSIGFGKVLFRWQDKKGTEYAFSLIPLGGYVKMLDENEETVPSSQMRYAFNRQPFYKKFLIVLAGPVMNLLCAFGLYWIIFSIGFVSIIPRIGQVAPHTLAAEAGLQPNEVFISINHHQTDTWTHVIFRLLSQAGNLQPVEVQTENVLDKKITTHHLDLSNWQITGLTPDLFGTLGIKPYQPSLPLVIGVILKDSPAAHSDLKIGDTIVKINDHTVKNWQDIMTNIASHPDENLKFTIKRNQKTLQIPITLGSKQPFFSKKTGYLGISPNFTPPKDFIRTIQYSPLAAIPVAWQEMINFSYFNLLLFGKLITGTLSLETLGGPITIFESAGTALNVGLISFLSFLAFLSISIGIINLFPIPGLDGGHLLIQTIEAIIRRPLPEKILINLYRFGFLILIFVLLQAIINDLLRL